MALPENRKFRNKLAARTQRRLARERFSKSRLMEKQYERQLLTVARYTGALIKSFAPSGIVTDMPGLMTVLNRYVETLRPWAFAVSSRMQAQVSQRDEKAWIDLGREVGRELRREIAKAPTGRALKSSLAEQVDLITTIPLKAAQRVHLLTQKALSESTRSSEIQKEIMRSGKVTQFEARRIAQTEVGRTASVLTETRARSIGSEGYFWRTAKDSDVRDLHKKLEGKFIRWDNPPIAGSRGERAHAGAIYFCRCYPEVTIPDMAQLMRAA
jgi:SPP1 gp7 family putative phage head morphogenesis protein